MYYYGNNVLTKDYFLNRLVESPPPVVAIDSETLSLSERMPIGFSIATSPDEAFYFPTYPEFDPAIPMLKKVLTDPSIKKVFHNALFDLRALPLVVEIDRTNIADTAVLARLLGEEDSHLAWLAPSVGKDTTPIKLIMEQYKAKTTLDVPESEIAQHCAQDSRATFALYNRYWTDQIDRAYYAVEMEVIPILIDMGFRGVRFNEGERKTIESRLENEVEYYGSMVKDLGANPTSNQQVGFILAKRGNFLPLTRGGKSGRSKQLRTDKEALEFLDDPMAAAILGFRASNKLLTTYIKPLAGKDRIYTEYGLDTVVGRTTSSNMNMQNIPPGETRTMFMPDSGVFTTGDYARLHMYILMHFSNDRMMKRILLDGEYNYDIHQWFSDQIPAPRKLGKTINLAIPYGATANTIRIKTKINDKRRCQALLDIWFNKFPDAAEWLKGATREGLREGWALPTLFGRRIRLPTATESEDELKNKAVNYPILGSDGEIIKRALIKCYHDKLPLAITVHDSITCDGDIEFPLDYLENIPPVRVPFEVKKTVRWE